MRNFLALTFLLVSIYPCISMADDISESGTLSFVLENDAFYNRDGHYTSGVRVVWVPRANTSVPDWAQNASKLVPWFPAEKGIRHGYAFGQSMFGPNDITIENPSLDERPYAGWLYISMGLGVETGKQLDLMSLSVGVVGPLSLAEETQKFIHKVIDTSIPQGWDTQLENEPGIVWSYQRNWRGLATKTLINNELDFTPHIGMALGNVHTNANAGITMRYGKKLPNDYGPPRMLLGLPGYSDFSPSSDFGWYVFIGIDTRVIAQNIFLDGNTFRDSRSVDKKLLVGDLQWGGVLDWPSLRISYTHVLRSREFNSQDKGDVFGALSVSFKF